MQYIYNAFMVIYLLNYKLLIWCIYQYDTKMTIISNTCFSKFLSGIQLIFTDSNFFLFSNIFVSYWNLILTIFLSNILAFFQFMNDILIDKFEIQK